MPPPFSNLLLSNLFRNLTGFFRSQRISPHCTAISSTFSLYGCNRPYRIVGIPILHFDRGRASRKGVMAVSWWVVVTV